MNWIVVAGVLLGLLLLAGLVAGVLTALGGRLPEGHVATVRARFAQPPEAIWEAITNMAAAPNWRSGLRQVERLPDRDGKQVWVEVSRQGRMPLEIDLVEPRRRLVAHIAGEKLPFGGSWTWEIAPDGRGSTLTITEDGVIYNPAFRFMARHVFGYDGTMKTYLRDLGKKFGEKVVPERLR
jgi:uncharacterized protein YndB with AHSA1/START domain